MAKSSVEERCEACGRGIGVGQQAFADGEHVLCELCYRSKHLGESSARAGGVAAVVPGEARVVGAAMAPVPRYRVLTMVANTIMLLGLMLGVCIFGFGVFIMLSGGLSAWETPRGANPMLDLRGPLLATSMTAGLVLMLYGLLVPLGPLAVGQLLLAVRDIAVNSFHTRHALARVR